MQQFLENAAGEFETSSLNFCAAKKAALKQRSAFAGLLQECMI